MSKTDKMGLVSAVAVLIAVVAGCKSAPPTPDESWSRYCVFYKSSGVAAERSASPAVIERVQSAQFDAACARQVASGLVEIGTFDIDGAREIEHDDVLALAGKLGAVSVVWNTVTTLDVKSELPNAAMAIPGTDLATMGRMAATRADETIAEHTVRKHTIRMFGNQKKGN